MACLVTHASFAEIVGQAAREKELEETAKRSQSDVTAAWKVSWMTSWCDKLSQKSQRPEWLGPF